jgi:hypothetical protein
MPAANRIFVILREAAFPFLERYEMDASLFTLSLANPRWISRRNMASFETMRHADKQVSGR